MNKTVWTGWRKGEKNPCEVGGDSAVLTLRRRSGETLRTVIDAQDVQAVLDFPGRWHPWFNRHTQSWYVRANVPAANGKKSLVWLHRFIMKAPAGFVVDHMDGDSLNNRRSNLRVVSDTVNKLNRHKPNRNNRSTGIRGVRWAEHAKKWRAVISVGNRPKYLGYFDTPEEAQEAVKVAVSERIKELTDAQG